MTRSIVVLVIALLFPALPIQGQTTRKSCEELKAEIAAKLDAKGVKNYTLDIVVADQIKDEKVVGSCDGGTKKITYKRN